MITEKRIIAGIIAGALFSIEQLTNPQLVTMRIIVDKRETARDADGFEKIEHLFNEDGFLIHSILEDAFSIEVNRRVAAGEWE